MEKPFIEIDSKYIIMHPLDAQPIKGFEFPFDKKTNIKFPFCCAGHTKFYHDTLEWFKKFPNCCDAHKELAKNPIFNKAIYQGTPERILKQSVYTEYVIQEKLNNEDWFEDITDYIDYNVMCMGQPAVGLHLYFWYLKQTIKRKDIVGDSNKGKKLLSFIENYYASPEDNKAVEITDMNTLFETYQKWFDIFPFELSYFLHLKPMFEKKLPLFRGEVKVNRYSGMTIGKGHTKDSLIDFLLKRTDDILMSINAEILLEHGGLKNPDAVKLELIRNERRLKIGKSGSGYLKNTITDEQQFRDILGQWFTDEKKFIDEIKPLLNASPAKSETIVTTSNIFNDNLTTLNFLELPKVKILSDENQKKLLKLLNDNGIPYCIAMFDLLDFLDYLQKEHFNTKSKLNLELSKIFNSDKDGRTVKGNINSLKGYSTESKERYTAHLHKEKVLKDYNELK